MKLYIKQKVFSIGDKYNVYDANENLVFKIQGEIFTLTSKMHLLDTMERELFFIRKRITLFLANYEIYQNNMLTATVCQEWSFFRPKLRVDSAYGSYQIQGDFLSLDFQIIKDGLYLGSVSKKWLSWGDSYELDIPNTEDAAFVVALVVAIDNCIHNENK